MSDGRHYPARSPNAAQILPGAGPFRRAPTAIFEPEHRLGKSFLDRPDNSL